MRVSSVGRFSNEITIDPNGDTKLDGNQIKRFNSGGDELSARKNFKDETYFHTQAHQLICCNDLCEIEPSDAKETGILFEMPSKFVKANDERLKLAQSNPHAIAYKVADDTVKTLAQKPAIIDAWTWAVIDQFKPHYVQVPTSMKDANDEFRCNAGVSEYDVFHDQFHFTNDSSDSAAIHSIKRRVLALKLAVTSQRYNKWLKARGCTQKKIGTERCWLGLLLDSREPDIFAC